jgi:K+ transport systems, NAD-binding component
LEALPIKDGVLVAGIIRDGKVIIPNGKSTLHKNDSVIIITRITGMQNLEDILK